MSVTNPPKASSQSWEYGKQPSLPSSDDGSAIQSNRADAGFWTFDAVQERLVEAMHLWRRSPGGGRWPFAGDGPWQLVTRAARIEEGGFKGREYQLRLQAEDAEEAKHWEGRDRRGGLNREEVARRDEASEWLRLVPERDRLLVVTVLCLLAKGVERVPWMRLKSSFGVKLGAWGLQRRFQRAIAGIAKALNAG